MYSMFLVFVWRRKILVFVVSLFCLIGVWAWAIYYTTYGTASSNTSSSYYNDDGNKILSVREFDGARERIIAKYGTSPDQKSQGVQFMHPTERDNSLRLRERFQSFSSFFLNKDADKILQNNDDSSRDEMARRKSGPENDRSRLAAEKQAKYERELHRMGIPMVIGIGPKPNQNPPNQRLVHLDLKGAPPKIGYLKRLLPIFRSLGATGLLIEYEDMFPFMSPIHHISAKNAYTETEIRELLHAAAVTGLSVMPLVQTFGHVEFALKLKEYEHLREVPESPQSLCPSLNDSINFIETMITQVVDMHLAPVSNQSNNGAIPSADESTQFLTPNFTHLHIGCDEVYRIGECSRCRMRQHNDLFLSHVEKIASFVRKKWPQLKVVIWDDMLRQIQLSELQATKLGSLVEPMVWVYADDIYRYVSHTTWEKYAMAFPTVWTASAFKGAHGETLVIPPARRHLENNLKWLSVINAESARFSNGIQGIAITGWQRYDHFAVLCELLPTSIPSLALSLSAVAKGYFDTNIHQNHILSALTCPEPTENQQARRPWIDLHHDADMTSFGKCMFPGSQTLRYALRLTSTLTEARQYINDMKYKRGWLTTYNIRHNFSSPIRVEELIGDAFRLESSLSSMAKNAVESMIEVFDKWTIDEFLEQTIMPVLEELQKMQKEADQLMSRRVWPKRPLPYFLHPKTDTIEENVYEQ